MNKRITTEIIIDASKEKVWEVLTDFAGYPSWNPFIVSVKGELKPSGRLVNTLMNGDKKMVFRPKVLRVELYQYFNWIGHLFVPGLFDGHHSFEIEELSPNQVKLIHSEIFSGILSTPILKKIGAETRENFIKMNVALRERVSGL